jgi:hypothetical protein
MADKDLKLIQEQADGSIQEVSITPVAGEFLKFNDATSDPESGAAGGGGGTVQGTDGTYDIQAANEGAVAGNARGENSVDLQTYRTNPAYVASGDFSAVIGGFNNSATADNAIAGGFSNDATGYASTAFGHSCLASGDYSFVVGGPFNTAEGDCSVAMGRRARTGANNGTFVFADSTNADFTALAADTFNIRASGGLRLVDGNESDGYVLTCDANGTGTWQAAAGGGGGGTVQGTDGTYDIQAANEGATAGNARGENSVDLQTSRTANTMVAARDYASILGGLNNSISGDSDGGAICGGNGNTISANYSGYEFIGGGQGNIISGAFLGAGQGVICGGQSNTITNGEKNVICGGSSNTIIGSGAPTDKSVIVGGSSHDITASFSVICGGTANNISSPSGFIGGGTNNTVSGFYSGVMCGAGNTASAAYSSAIGGSANEAGGSFSFVGGGTNNTASGSYSVAMGRRAKTGDNNGVFIFADSTDADFTAIAADTFNIRADGLRLVDGNQSDGYVLTCDANGTGTWQAAAGGGGGGGTVQGTDTNTYNIAATDEGTIASTTARGENSVDLQTSRTANTMVAARPNSGILSGTNNTVSGSYSYGGTIAGGWGNTISASYSGEEFIGGGASNRILHDQGAGSTNSTIVAGYENTITSSQCSFIGGGRSHTITSGANAGHNVICGGGTSAGDIDKNSIVGAYSFIGGGAANTVSNYFCFLGGGANNNISGQESCVTGGRGNSAEGSYTTVSGGFINTASGDYAVVSGGKNNEASGIYSTVSGGRGNTASGSYTVVGGDRSTASGGYGVALGKENSASGYYSSAIGGAENTASSSYATVISGYQCQASGYHSAVVCGGENSTASGARSIVLGGSGNAASGNYSVAMGRKAKTGANNGSFRFADSTNADFTTGQAADSFGCRFSGGYNFYTDAGCTTGVTVAAGGGSWASVSDKTKKENYEPINHADTLEKLKSLPVEKWNYISQKDDIKHIGPYAQDFHAAFGLNGDMDKNITHSDAEGVLFSAVKALIAENDELKATIGALSEELMARIEALENK